MSAMARHRDPGAGSFWFGVEQLDGAAVHFYHSLRVHQAQADTVTLRRNEWIEHAVADYRVDADAIVAHVEDDRRAARCRSGGDPQCPSGGHRIGGVSEDVDEDLPESIRVDTDQREPVGQVSVDHDLAVRQLWRQLGEDVANDIVHWHGARSQFAGPGELNQIFDDGLDLLN